MNSRSNMLFQNFQSDIQALGQVIPYHRIPFIPVRLDTSYVAASSLCSSMVKKYVPTDPSVLASTKRAAIALFDAMNSRCLGELGIEADYLIANMRMISERELGEPQNWQDLLCHSGLLTGPGSSVSSRGRNSSLEKFFINDLTTTNPFLYCEYIRFIRSDATFHLAERFRRHKCGRAFLLVEGSNLTTVPKTFSIDRVICTEPSLNMVFQRSLACYFDGKLSKFYGYDPALQPDRNRALAKQGSLYGNIGTIDLSSASDTISLKLLQRILPDWCFTAINDCRSHYTNVDSQLSAVNMFATMGNGFTFSLQTYVFSLMIKALCLIKSFKFERYDRRTLFGVFGDDLCVPAPLFDDCIKALKSLNMIPNMDKSFNTGFFRESCGTDWYDGVNVRGVYIKSLDTINDRFSAVNRLTRFCALHNIPCLSAIQGLLPATWRSYAVPSDESDDSGIKTPDHVLHRSGTFRYRCLKPMTKKLHPILLDVIQPAFFNPMGFIKWATTTVANDGLARRSKIVNYRRESRSCPSWVRPCDFVNPAHMRRWTLLMSFVLS